MSHILLYIRILYECIYKLMSLKKKFEEMMKKNIYELLSDLWTKSLFICLRMH